MNIFLSRYLNKIDKKGRVSIPAVFRSVLGVDGSSGMIIYPSFKNNCLEACSLSRMEYLSKMILNLDPYSQERDAFETVILGESVHLSFDQEGRVSIPSYLLEQALIKEDVYFIGKGLVFEIWQPELFNRHLTDSKQIAQANKLVLKDIHISN